MTPLFSRMLISLAALATLWGVTGCSSINDNPGRPVREVDPSQAGIISGTGPESQDVVAIADQMVRSLLGAPAIANADEPPTVVLLEFRNESRFPIDGDIFLRKLRVQLNSQAAGRMLFLARERMEAIQREREAKRAGDVTADPDRQAKAVSGADYFLTGEVGGIAKATRLGREDYLLYTFTLIDTETSAVVWEDQFETKRVGQEDAVYR